MTIADSAHPQTSSPLSLFAQIREDSVAHAAIVMRPGFKCIALYRFGVWRMRLRPRIFRMPFSLLYRILYWHLFRGYGVELPYTAVLGRRVTIHHPGGIVIGGAVVMGDDCAIFQGVTLGARYGDHEFNHPRIGNRVIIGAGAKVLGGVKIGDDVRIGANAVVLDDVPDGATAVGVPARIIPPRVTKPDSPKSTAALA